MAEAFSDSLREGARAAEVASRPNVFPVLVAIGSLLFVGVLIWKLAGAQIEIMREMARQLRANSLEMQSLHDAFVSAGLHVRKAQPASVEEE